LGLHPKEGKEVGIAGRDDDWSKYTKQVLKYIAHYYIEKGKQRREETALKSDTGRQLGGGATNRAMIM